ncbi:MAG: imidazoleglycerol-phosphate dehydratase, partial [Halanaerobiales bacterium]|nr:imidazoleglycerol-phosphate dehydratase [Halanaerobiales bacterium]
MNKRRMSSYSRKTNETEVSVELDLNGNGSTEIDTKINFFNHMLKQLGKHSGFDLKVTAIGDLKTDDHHTVEDIGITLGESFNQALGDKKGIVRFADTIIPCAESLVRVVIDISGRPYLNSNLK